MIALPARSPVRFFLSHRRPPLADLLYYALLPVVSRSHVFTAAVAALGAVVGAALAVLVVTTHP